MSSTTPTKHTVSLGPIALSKLAVLSTQIDAVADRLEIEVRTDRPTPHTFTPDAKLIKAAKLGIARLVCAQNANLAGVSAADAAQRLVKAGVPAPTARLVAESQQRYLTAAPLSDRKVAEAIQALVSGAQMDDRL